MTNINRSRYVLNITSRRGRSPVVCQALSLAGWSAGADPMLGPRQQRILAVLDQHPGGVLVEVLLAELSAARRLSERAKAIETLHRLVAAGLINNSGKQHRTKIAGALVTGSLTL